MCIQKTSLVTFASRIIATSSRRTSGVCLYKNQAEWLVELNTKDFHLAGVVADVLLLSGFHEASNLLYDSITGKYREQIKIIFTSRLDIHRAIAENLVASNRRTSFWDNRLTWRGWTTSIRAKTPHLWYEDGPDFKIIVIITSAGTSGMFQSVVQD